MFNSALSVLTALTMHILIAGTSTASASIFGVTYTPTNGYNKINVVSVLSGTGAIDTSVKAYRVITVSNNPSMSPVVQQLADSFMIGSLLHDTLPVSMTYPTKFYVHVDVFATDTSGVVDTALSLTYLPVDVTPDPIAPDMVLQNPVIGPTTVSFTGTFNSGYKEGHFKVLVDYGSKTFGNSSPYPAKRDTFTFLLGSNQLITRTYTINIGSTNYDFSYRGYFENGVGADTSSIFSGTTLGDTTEATIATPYSPVEWADSIRVTIDAVTGNLPTDAWGRISLSQNGPDYYLPIKKSLGAKNGTTTFTLTFPALTEKTTYWIQVCDSNKLNTFGASRSNWISVTTAPKDVKFGMFFDTLQTTGYNDVDLFVHRLIGPGNVGHTHVLVAGYPTHTPIVLQTTLPDITSLMDPNDVIHVTGLMDGRMYSATMFGNDDLFSGFYVAWQIEYVFTFVAPIMTGVVDDNFGLEKVPLNVYPNPVVESATFSISDPDGAAYEIIDASGRIVLASKAETEKTTFSRGNLAAGTYFLTVHKDGKLLQKQFIIQ